MCRWEDLSERTEEKRKEGDSGIGNSRGFSSLINRFDNHNKF